MALGGQATAGGQPIIIQGIQPHQLNQLNFQGGQLIPQIPQLANQIFINASHHHATTTASSPLPTATAGTPGPQQQQHPSTTQGATIHLHQSNLGHVAQQQHQQQVQQQVQQIQMQSTTPSNN